jgi:hypothetical protein
MCGRSRFGCVLSVFPRTVTQTGHVPCFAHSLEICTVEGKHACKPRRLAAHLLGFDFLDRRTSLSSQRDTNSQH